MENMANLSTAMMLLASTFSLAYLFCTYVFKSIGIFQIAKRWNLQNPVLAWIPIVNNCYMGYVADKLKAKKGKKTHYKILLIISTVANALLTFFAIILGVVAYLSKSDMVATILAVIFIFSILLFSVAIIAVEVFRFIALYAVFSECSPKYKVLYIILTILFKLDWLFLFIARNGSEVPLPNDDVPYYSEPTAEPQYVSVSVDAVEVNEKTNPTDEEKPQEEQNNDNKPNPFEEV